MKLNLQYFATEDAGTSANIDASSVGTGENSTGGADLSGANVEDGNNADGTDGASNPSDADAKAGNEGNVDMYVRIGVETSVEPETLSLEYISLDINTADWTEKDESGRRSHKESKRKVCSKIWRPYQSKNRSKDYKLRRVFRCFRCTRADGKRRRA